MEKQEDFCRAMEEGRCSWPRGRALGGSTVINYVIYTRGNPEDFRRWEAQGRSSDFFLQSYQCLKLIAQRVEGQKEIFYSCFEVISSLFRFVLITSWRRWSIRWRKSTTGTAFCLGFNREFFNRLGNPGWSYKDVLPYYLKSENCDLGKECNSKYHGKGGYLNVDYPYATKLTKTFLEAGLCVWTFTTSVQRENFLLSKYLSKSTGHELGEKLVDYNTAKYMGFAQIQANIKFGRRHSASAAFLDPFLHRTNLHVVTSARVTKILINPDTKEAYGVEFHKTLGKYTARARKEVILSAGTFHSPQLLMLSGIGPEDHLRELGTYEKQTYFSLKVISLDLCKLMSICSQVFHSFKIYQWGKLYTTT